MGERADRTGPLTVALLEDVEPSHAPWARTSSERLVFGQFYETLVRVDCEGAVRQGLAVAWRQEEDGRRWLFTLREDATFWDGTPVTPRDVVSSWAAAARSPGAAIGASSPWTGPPPRPRRFTVKGDGSFEVVFSSPYPRSPTAFAHSAVAIRRAGSGDGWPPGTGPYRPRRPGETGGVNAEAVPARAGGGDVLAVPVGDASGRPSLRFRAAAGRDARDLLGTDVDLILSRDPEVLAYAEAHPAFLTVALPWDRLYVFVSPGVSAAGAGGKPAGAGSGGRDAERGSDPAVTGLRRALARDVARSEARPARLPVRGEGGRLGSGRVLYPRDDADARALAERLVALAASPGVSGRAVPAVVSGLGTAGHPPRAVGVGPRELADALGGRSVTGPWSSAGTADALVLALPTWRLSGRGSERSVPGELAGALPLVETRARLILRRGISGVTVDGSGTPILSEVRP